MRLRQTLASREERIGITSALSPRPQSFEAGERRPTEEFAVGENTNNLYEAVSNADNYGLTTSELRTNNYGLRTKTMHPDQRYIDALRDGDHQVIKEIYARYAREAEQWVRANHGTTDDARDVFQEAVMVVYEKAVAGQLVMTGPLGALRVSG
jgi:hypothetical protein